LSTRRHVAPQSEATATSEPRRCILEAHIAECPMLIPFQWIGLFATLTVFAVMFAIGLMLGREQIAAALQRRVVLAAVVFAVVVPVPVLAVLALKLFALKGPVAVGIVLMAISPGVTATVIGYALGLGATMVAFVQWSKRR
jgi:predicted Na+-dependent transporter